MIDNDSVRRFEQWAAEGCGGMDGGNPTTELWFCGIEPGNDKEFNFSFESTPDGWLSYSEPTERTSLKPPYIKPEISDAIKDNFNQTVAEILGTVYTDKHTKYTELYGKEGSCFKLNLYPIPMSNHSDALWSRDHYNMTGFTSKIQYKAWCMDNRFPKLRELVSAYKPKAIICFGTTLKAEYSIAFSSTNDKIFDLFKKYSVEHCKKNYHLHTKRINGGETDLIVVPFPRSPVNYKGSNGIARKLNEVLKHSGIRGRYGAQ